MKNLFILLFVIQTVTIYSQNNNQSKVDSIKKNHFIYIVTSERISTTTTENRSTGKTSSASSRLINFSFSVGKNGAMQKFGKKGEKLEAILKKDPEAYAEFKNGLAHRKRSKLYNALEFVGYGVALGSCVPLVIGIIEKKDSGEVGPMLIGGGVGVVGGFVMINVFKIKCDSELDKFIESVNKSVEIYNKNLLAEKSNIKTKSTK